MNCIFCGTEEGVTKKNPGQAWQQALYPTVIYTCQKCWELAHGTSNSFAFETIVLAMRVANATKTHDNCRRNNYRNLFGGFIVYDVERGSHHGVLLPEYAQYEYLRPKDGDFALNKIVEKIQHLPKSREDMAKEDAEIAAMMVKLDDANKAKRAADEDKIRRELDRPYRPRYPYALHAMNLADWLRGR